MPRKNYQILFLFSLALALFSFSFSSSAFSQTFPQNTESITLTTYYPSPVGVYGELRSQRAAVGANYYDAANYPWDDGSGTGINQNTSLIVEDRVGIGTTGPRSLLELDSYGTAHMHEGNVLLVGDSKEVGRKEDWARGIGLFKEDGVYAQLA